MRRRGRSSSLSGYCTHSRTELVGFAPAEVEYEIHGVATNGSAGSWEEPPDPGELEITEVHRTDPLTGIETRLADKDWPFSDKEFKNIEDRLSENMEPTEYEDDGDDYDRYDR